MRATLQGLLIILIMLTLGLKRYNPEHHRTVTKEQLVAFVKEAQAFIRIYGKEEALREFNDPTGLFDRGELYIAAYDFNCIVLAYGRDPSLKGTDFTKLTDPTDVKICKEKNGILMKNPSGWLKYTFAQPKTNKILEKLSYFERVGNEDWYISSGLYLNDD
jgi:cytochrome c